ncbi:hypothetical protein PENSOL_c002G03972 [Penicillium solitum]|uniref:Fibronectin type-III domain-containing protein n=1 Tax=Penicillium solitum TaxID=60172 RepID=A0A1V6RLN1_9EURO|nr:uncharacterized protein PENSOL_c002G03972 [Penicillium solitum]OQE02263.1 hypothetical protein PENSOL_c002G03972 [Penicillium solitum]
MSTLATEGVASKIDWNNAAALEFLGAPATNKDQQSEIQAVFENTATVIYSNINPFPHWIKIRCDDPSNLCPKSNQDDPCQSGSSKRDGQAKVKTTLLAYATNDDPDSPGYPMINLCEEKARLSNYENRGALFLHELFHLNVAANSPDPNPSVIDLNIKIKYGTSGILDTPAYGPLATKVLARWQGNQALGTAGFWVQRNADNLAHYALAKYVMTKNGGIYPHLPIVTYEIDGPPHPGSLASFVREGSDFYLNTTSDDDITIWSGDYPVCDDDLVVSAASSSLTIDGFVPASDYPDSYNKQVSTWIEELGSTDGGSDSGSGGDAGQQIAIASYINPLGDSASWGRLLAYDTSKVSVLVANVLNGPDYVVDESWKLVIDQAASQGKKILGYVRTGYLGVSQQQFTTRLGSHDLADWASQIEQDIDKWFELYGTSLGGIFFDEGWPECGPNSIYADLYAYINKYTKQRHPGAYTVLNPGSPIAQCFEDTMDTLLTFESSYDTYTSSYVPNDWTPKDPRKLWHIIYKVPQDQIATIAALASSRHAGLLEITDDGQPNPYDNLPSEAYMQALIGAVPGGTPPINDLAKAASSYADGLPSDVAVSSSDYSSVTLTWSSVANALGYGVYKDGTLVLELPASLTRATVGMLDPGSSGISFEVRTVLASGSGGGSSRTILASTKSLPSDGPIANVRYTQNGDTVVYKADVLVPYAFVRLFIGIKQPDVGIGRGWPIQVPEVDAQGVAHHEIVNYMVEGNEFYSGFYKYTGAWYETTTANADWTWASIGVAPQSQSGYTYTWNVPFTGTDAVASEYVIQGQGYAPLRDVFIGTLRQYGAI